MKSGFGKIRIEVIKKIKLTGIENNRISEGVLDPLYARSIVIEDKKKNIIIILSLDLLFVGKKLSKIIKEEIYKKYKIPRINILIKATHTHSAPKTCEQFIDGINIENKFFENVQRSSISAVSKAIKSKKKCEIELYDIPNFPAVNRRLIVPKILRFYPGYYKKKCINRPNRKKISDTSCRAIKFCLSDNSIFWLLNASAHCTVYNGNKISSDYPGYIEKHLLKLSQKNNCKGLLFLQGWAGDQNCDVTKKIKLRKNPISFLETLFIKELFNRSSSQSNLNEIGKIIAKKVLRSYKVKTFTINNIITKFAKINLPLENKMSVSLNIRYFNLGEIKFYILNGEPLSNYRELLLNNLQETSKYNIFTVGYSDHPIGYIPDEQALKEGGYETDRSLKFFGLRSRFSKEIEQKILKCFKDIEN
tara:strand:- start:1 stop:1257 length:1257 start_codon:yes stop_codon:yes gene_type:complete